MEVEEIEAAFRAVGGSFFGEHPAIHSKVWKTPRGTPYLRGPGVVLISKPDVSLDGVAGYLGGFDKSLGFDDYLKDSTRLGDAETLLKFAGQLCYASFSDRRTLNADSQGYFNNVIASGHGSVLEHANFSVLWYGVSRSLTHEVVRHRAGVAFSQLSQRYVSGKVLRFVERPEFQTSKTLHSVFEDRIDRTAGEYEALAGALLALQGSGFELLSGGTKTDRRKKVQQVARAVLTNETETALVMTANVRSLRHMSSMRVSEHAEVEIREAMYHTFLCVAMLAPSLFSDYEICNASDGTKIVKSPYPKV